MWDRRAKYISNHDGDTITVRLDQGFDDTKQLDIRLFGVYAPELDERGGPECKKFVQDWFTEQLGKVGDSTWPFIVTTMRMKKADHEQMTFTRYVGMITSLDGSQSLNALVTQYILDNNFPGGVGS